MLFTSLSFVIFFSVFFLLYWYIFDKSVKLQNLLVLTGSYIFYAWWDWRFVFLLAGSSLLNYFLGIWIAKASEAKHRTALLWIGMVQGLGCLIVFKYFNFFVASITGAFSTFNIHFDFYTINILLPLGISFYTFKTLSYLLDIKNGKIEPTNNWVVFFSYVAFFPCLISGPIDRPKTLLPQLEKKRIFNYEQASDGMRQILWGLFKKIVIADNCAAFTSAIFDHYKIMPASSLLLGAFFATIQIYADFSGYSDMAIGFSNLLGINITRNFNSPFFAQNIAVFWRRWHISLTTWLTDYVFTPLSIYFRYYGKLGQVLAILVNFTLIGIWHGANWTFILYGFLNGCYYIPLIIKGTINKKQKLPDNQLIPSLRVIVNMIATFLLVMFTIVIFRSDSLTQAFGYYSRFFSTSIFSKPIITEKINTIATLIGILIMFIAEWLQRDKQHPLQIDAVKNFLLRLVIYYGLVIVILFFSANKTIDFIYFKF